MTNRVEITKELSEILINAYFEIFHKEVNQAFWDSFLLGKNQSISVGALFSKNGESLIYVFPSEANELIVECTNYPVQFAFFGGLMDFRSLYRKN